MRGASAILIAPATASTMNQTTITGPNTAPMPDVPCFCITNRVVSAISVIGIT